MEIEFRAYEATNAKMRDWDFIKKHILFPGNSGWEWSQFTGSKDSTGRKIFDGDIGRDEGGNLCRIFWNEDDSGFAADFPDGEMTSVAEAAGYIEIIDNRFDNPDLWEKINAG
jgi:hypothetical protein